MPETAPPTVAEQRYAQAPKTSPEPHRSGQLDSVIKDREHDDDDVEEDDPSPDERAQNAEARQAALHKRRRVTRACDECRRKKIKCDGKQPCTHCTIFTYDCSYDQPSTRRRNPGPHYIEGLENKLHRAEALLKVVLPNLDGLDDPAIDIAIREGYIPNLETRETRSQTETSVPDTNIESMVNAVGSIELDENGKWDYSGHSSGLSFMRHVREHLGDVMGPHTPATPFVKTLPTTTITESPRSSLLAASDPPVDTQGGLTGGGGGSAVLPADLPGQMAARAMCRNAISEVAVLLRVVHEPTFWASFDRIYTVPPSQYADEDHRFLPLLYTTLAVGVVYGNEQDNTYEATIEAGTKFFKAARQLMDIADCRDLTAIQAVIFIIFFLQCSAKLSTCYVYVGIVLRSALRLGLHRSISKGFNPLECEMRKRVFWTIRKLDIYMAVMLGLPQTLSDEDIDQEYPVEVDDDYVTVDGIAPMPEGSVSFMTAFNVHTDIVLLLAKVNRNVYPARPKDGQPGTGKSYTVPFSVITEIEKDLENWKRNLPPGLSPAHQDPRLIRVQQMLRLAYAFVQSLLYRPFLHFVGSAKRSRETDGRALACAMSYVNVSRNLVHLAIQMKQKNLLNGALWVVMYMTYFSIMSLVYFATENPDSPAIEGLLKDSHEGRAVLKALSKRSMAADRCTATLDTVFEGLPDWIRNDRPPPVTSRKRRQDGGAAVKAPEVDSRANVSRSQMHDARQEGAPLISPSAPSRSMASSNSLSILQDPTSDTVGDAVLYDTQVSQQPLESKTPQHVFTGVPGEFAYTWHTQQEERQEHHHSSLQHQTVSPHVHPSPAQMQYHPSFSELSAMMLPTSEAFPHPSHTMTSSWEDTWDARQTSAPVPAGLTDGQIQQSSQFDLPAALTSPYNYLPQETIHGPSHGHGSMAPGMPWNGQVMSRDSGTLPSHSRQDLNNHHQQQSQHLAQHRQHHQHQHQPTQGFSEVNLNGIFGGEDWNSMPMDQGYRH